MIMSLKQGCSLALEPALLNLAQTRFFLLLSLVFSLSVIFYLHHLSRGEVNHHAASCFLVNQTPSKEKVINSGLRFTWKLMQSNKTTTIPHFDKPVSRPPYAATPSNYHFIMDEPDKCKENPFLVFMVPVAPHQFHARHAIRSTWGNESTVQGKTIVTLFLVGLTVGDFSEKVQEELKEESQQHRDLIQSDFVDSYFNLTIKTMVIMDWLATRCPQASFAMKVDSDMFINVDNLMTLLLRPDTPRENYITGMLMWNRPVLRDKKSKWYVSEGLYPEPIYPTYLMGMGYVFSNDLPRKLVEASKVIKLFNVEDAYIGACLKQLGVKPSKSPDPSQFRTFMMKPKGHNLSKVITTIARSPKQIIEFWKSVKRH